MNYIKEAHKEAGGVFMEIKRITGISRSKVRILCKKAGLVSTHCNSVAQMAAQKKRLGIIKTNVIEIKKTAAFITMSIKNNAVNKAINSIRNES